MADFEVKITPRSGITPVKAIAESLDQLARREHILEHLAQSRRARESSNIDSKIAAVQARIERRLAAQRQEYATAQAQVVGAAPFAEAEQRPGQAADDVSRKLSGVEAAAGQSSIQN